MYNNAVITARDLSIGYRTKGHKEALHSSLNFSLKGGNLTCLLGPNGAGKSTLLRTLSASQPILGGELMLTGKMIESFSEKELSRTIGLVLTEKTFAGALTVRQLVSLGRQPHTGFFGHLSAYDKEIVEHALHLTGIDHKADTYTAQLSDGERQKAMIAKAIVQECPIILLDEPTAFLDAVSRIEILTLLHRLAHDENKAILLSTHDIEQALVTAEYLWRLSRENRLHCGVTEDVILSGMMDRLFPEADIKFDIMHGGFSPTVKANHSIILHTEDQVLKHWTQNALNRHGFLCLEESLATDKKELPELYVLSRSEINLNFEGRKHSCCSYGELIDLLSVLNYR